MREYSDKTGPGRGLGSRRRGSRGLGFALLATLIVLGAVMALLVPPKRVVFGSAISSEYAAVAPGSDSTKAPDFSVKGLDGTEVKLSAYRGKVVMVNFWATWCVPCRFELPQILKLESAYHDKGLQIIGLSLDDPEPAEVSAFVKELKIDYPIGFSNAEILKDYGPVDAIPLTIIIDREGNVSSRHEGIMSYQEMEKSVKGLL